MPPIASDLLKLQYLELLEKHVPAYYLDIAENTQPCNLSVYVTSKNFICDSTVTGVVTASPSGGLYLHYLYFYALDAGMTRCRRVFDAHDYDIEHIVIELNAVGAVQGVLYQPHGQKEHFWIRHASDLAQILVEGLHPKAFASIGKHAMYPCSGRIFRYFGIANDKCFPGPAQDVGVVLASDELMQLQYIDGVYRALPGRISQDFGSKKEVRLSAVKTRLFFALPKRKK